jgi:hypothetical protein
VISTCIFISAGGNFFEIAVMYDGISPRYLQETMWRDGNLKIRDKEHADLLMGEINKAFPSDLFPNGRISSVANQEGDVLYVTERCVPSCGEEHKVHLRSLKDYVESQSQRDRDRCFREQEIYATAQLGRITLHRKRSGPDSNDEYAEYKKRISDVVSEFLDTVKKRSKAETQKTLNKSDARCKSLEEELAAAKKDITILSTSNKAYLEEIGTLKAQHQKSIAELGPAIELLQCISNAKLQLTKNNNA